MSTFRLHIPNDLKAKAQQLASEQGVSLNSYINATLAATIAQLETLAMMGDRLADIDQAKLHNRVMKFMPKKSSGSGPTVETIQKEMEE